MVFLHREACAQRNFCTQTPLHTEVFTQRRKFLHTDALYEEVFARINKGTQAFLHTEPLPQRNLCTEQFLHTDFLAPKKINTEKIVHTDCTKKNAHRLFCTQKTLPRTVCTQQQLFRTEAFPDIFFKCTAVITDRWFLHRKFSAQKSYAQKVLRTTVFLHTAAFIHRCLYTEDELHTETCAHSTLLHATSFYTERFCFPFLITYLSCSPSQVSFLFVVRSQILFAFFPFLSFFPFPFLCSLTVHK